jgi:hypothetical protein
MLAIHAIWWNGLLNLWAEDTAQPACPEVPVRGTAAASSPRPHPAAATASLLADVLAEFGEEATELVRKAAEAELTIWLPTMASAPLSSSDELTAGGTAGQLGGNGQLVYPASGAARSGRVKLTPWRVPAISLRPAGALSLLPLITAPGPAAERGSVTDSVRFFAAIADLAADLAGRGRVLPGLRDDGDGRYRACWRCRRCAVPPRSPASYPPR